MPLLLALVLAACSGAPDEAPAPEPAPAAHEAPPAVDANAEEPTTPTSPAEAPADDALGGPPKLGEMTRPTTHTLGGPPKLGAPGAPRFDLRGGPPKLGGSATPTPPPPSE